MSPQNKQNCHKLKNNVRFALLQDNLKRRLQNKRLPRTLINACQDLHPTRQKWPHKQTHSPNKPCVLIQRTEKWNQHFAFTINVYKWVFYNKTIRSAGYFVTEMLCYGNFCRQIKFHFTMFSLLYRWLHF